MIARHSMSVGEIVSIGLAGLAAGAINTVVGSGTLITFPVLLAFGYAPVTANVSNNVGLVAGSVSGAWGYRDKLEGQRQRAIRLGIASALGGLTGAVLLLVLSPSTFKAIVPVFIGLALILTVLAPRLNARLQKREAQHPVSRALTPLAVYGAGIYGGYFGAAQGILLLGILGVLLDQDLQRTNALKNVLAGIVNGVAAIYFIFAAHIAWAPAAIIAVSSVLGAQLGARYGQRLDPAALRVVIVVVGIAAIVKLVA